MVTLMPIPLIGDGGADTLNGNGGNDTISMLSANHSLARNNGARNSASTDDNLIWRCRQ